MLLLLFIVVMGYEIIFVRTTAPLIPQVIGVSAVAATMLAGIVVVYVLDAPFDNRGAQLPPSRMTSAVSTMESAYQADPATIPCDAQGKPKP
ncbi:MAG TPA: hypothetical protein VNC14_11495, partial [Lapillicoccus sp.]|nr:hypothetical protein [Lapillicoccus sp.]